MISDESKETRARLAHAARHSTRPARLADSTKPAPHAPACGHPTPRSPYPGNPPRLAWRRRALTASSVNHIDTVKELTHYGCHDNATAPQILCSVSNARDSLSWPAWTNSRRNCAPNWTRSARPIRTPKAQLRAAIASDAAATPPDNPAIDSEVRERLELRAKTGIGDFLRAAVGGAAVSGAAAEYADACGVPTVGHLPMAIFARPAPTVETRAITPGPAVKGILQPTVPFVFERSAAASLGIMMPTVPMGQVQIPKITTAPPADTLAKDGAAPAAAAAVTLVNQAPVRIAGQFEVRVEDLAVMPTLEAALSESMQGSMSNELDESTFNGAVGELNGLFTQAANVAAAGNVETFATGIARFAALGGRATRLRPL